MSPNFSSTANEIWAVADLLRGDFRQSQYGRIILPFALLRRLECVLAPTKAAVIAKLPSVTKMPVEAQEKLLLREAKQFFYNTSPMSMASLGSSDTAANLEKYIQSFSPDAREIFEHFKFADFIHLLDDANLLYLVIPRFSAWDPSPKAIDNYHMGLVFEELIRKFAESSNDTAGEHFTPRDIVRLTTALVFIEDDDLLTRMGIVRSIYDPTAGTGGMISSGMEYVHELNSHARLAPFGQELNPESYAICKADMLIKGQDVSKIRLGNTLSDDQLAGLFFDYMLSNPPFGVDWKKIQKVIFLAVFSGSISTTITLRSLVDPRRNTVSELLVPGLVLPTMRGRSLDFSTGLPSNLMMMSPNSTPALSAGAPASTPLTRAPCGLPKPIDSATSLLTGPICTPIRPRVTRPFARSCSLTRTASSIGIENEIPMDPPERE